MTAAAEIALPVLPDGALTGPETEEKLEITLAVLAYIVDRHGAKYMPLFDRIENDLMALRRRNESAKDRAMRVLDRYRRDGGLKAIR